MAEAERTRIEQLTALVVQLTVLVGALAGLDQAVAKILHRDSLIYGATGVGVQAPAAEPLAAAASIAASAPPVSQPAPAPVPQPVYTAQPKPETDIWRVTSPIRAVQGPGRLYVTFTLLQDGSQLRGQAKVAGASAPGIAEGTLVGNDFEVQVEWPNGQVGIYAATVDRFGRLRGTAHEYSNPGNAPTWESETSLTPAAR
jgi:hypothetical protein